MTCRRNRCTIYRNEMKSETNTYDSVITNRATSGTSECLEASNEIMTVNSSYAAGENIDMTLDSTYQDFVFVMFIETFVNDSL